MLATPGAIREISTREYAGFQRLVADSSGITLTDAKRQLLVGRVARVVRERGYASYDQYLEAIRSDASGGELVRLLDLVTTNETRFFRERGHYEYLSDQCLPAWREAVAQGRRSRTVKVWSAACSTGQEPYSLLMLLLDRLPASEGWTIEMLASDLSTRALDVAARGEYDVSRAPEIPPDYLRRFMRRGVRSHAGVMRASPELQQPLRFDRINLNEPISRTLGPFDLVFCSNALIYFSRAGRASVVARLASTLAPGGRLFVGHAESLHEHRPILRSVAPTVYAIASDTAT